MIANILRLRRTLRHRERWTRERLLEHQQHELATLRAFAVECSPFYRRLHRGRASAPLAALPVLTKAAVMDHFDEILIDPLLRLADLQAYLERLAGNEPYAGRYWVSATSGRFGAQECHSQRPARVGHCHCLIRPRQRMVAVSVSIVDSIPAGAAGKRPLVVAVAERATAHP